MIRFTMFSCLCSHVCSSFHIPLLSDNFPNCYLSSFVDLSLLTVVGLNLCSIRKCIVIPGKIAFNFFPFFSIRCPYPVFIVENLCSIVLSVADLEGVRGLTPPGQFFHFHAVFGENWPDNMLTPPLCSRLICEMLNPPLTIVVIFFFTYSSFTISSKNCMYQYKFE